MTSQLATGQPERALTQRDDLLLANVAMLYYRDGLTQNEIATRLGVSRATVVNHLRQARERNIVEIRVKGASFSASTLSKELREAFGLDDVFIAATFPDPEADAEGRAREIVRQVARVGAMAVYDLVQPGDVMGVAWGKTIEWLSEEMPLGSVPDLTVCQMIGSMKAPQMPAAETCAIRIASRLGADCRTLHAPAILSSRTIAIRLAAGADHPRSASAAFGVEQGLVLGRRLLADHAPDPRRHRHRRAMKWYVDRGAVAVLCGRFIDAKGRHVEGELDAAR